jgi:hypothetical protein
MTYGIIKIRDRVSANGKERARFHIWNPGTNDWEPLDFKVLVRIEKYGWPVMGKSWFEDGDRWYVADRWMALPMRLIEELGLSNYVLEEFERKPRWQVIIEE